MVPQLIARVDGLPVSSWTSALAPAWTWEFQPPSQQMEDRMLGARPAEGPATLAQRLTLASGLCKASVVAKAESIGRGLSGDGRFNRFDRTPGQTGAASA